MKYYFLAAYLPELVEDQTRIGVGLAELLQERFAIADRDWAEVDLVLLKGDVVILERLLAGRTPPAVPSLHGPQFWGDQLRAPKEGPGFILDFLAEQAGQPFTPADADRLHALYYQHALTASRNRFLQDYLEFEWDLRNLLAAMRARRLGLSPAEIVVGENDIAETLARSGAEDFGLGDQWPFVEKLLAASDPLSIQTEVERVLWDHLAEGAGTDPFSFDAILSYLLRLMILEARLALSAEDGASVLGKLEEA